MSVDRSSALQTFSEVDLRRWVDEGLLLQPQMDKILRLEATPETRRRGAEGINGPTILYYLGALVAVGVLLASVGIATTVAAAAVGGFATIKWTPYRQAGSLLVTIAVALIPFLLYDLIGASEQDADGESQLALLSVIQVLSFGIMVSVLLVTRVAMVAVAAAVQFIALVWTVSALCLEPLGAVEPAPVSAMIALTALGLIVLGFKVRKFGWNEESFWFGLVGHFSFFMSVTVIVFSAWQPATAMSYLAVFVTFIFLSVRLRSLMFALSGFAGTYLLVIRAIGEAFGGSDSLPWALVAVGLSMTLLARLYRPWRYGGDDDAAAIEGAS